MCDVSRARHPRRVSAALANSSFDQCAIKVPYKEPNFFEASRPECPQETTPVEVELAGSVASVNVRHTVHPVRNMAAPSYDP